MGLFSLTQELAIDLGTANTLIIYNGKVVAKGSNKIKAGPLCVVSGSVVDFIGEVGNFSGTTHFIKISNTHTLIISAVVWMS